uniref:Uncharacterized protein n=1 Tax=Terrapene triunguis TaxID=2587831 RepID=A0A674JJ13_9SAUR
EVSLLRRDCCLSIILTHYNKPCLLYFQRLHEGVIRDLERQSRKLENIRLLQEQITLTKQLEAERDKMLMEKGSHQS